MERIFISSLKIKESNSHFKEIKYKYRNSPPLLLLLLLLTIVATLMYVGLYKDKVRKNFFVLFIKQIKKKQLLFIDSFNTKRLVFFIVVVVEYSLF